MNVSHEYDRAYTRETARSRDVARAPEVHLAAAPRAPRGTSLAASLTIMPRNFEETEADNEKQIDPDDIDDDPESRVVRRDTEADDDEDTNPFLEDLEMEELDEDDLKDMEGPDA